MQSSEENDRCAIISETGRYLIENDAMQRKALLGDFKDTSDRHLSHLRMSLGILERNSATERDTAFYIDILRDCHTIKESAEQSHQTDIKQLVHCFEVVIELLRRKKICESNRVYHYLNEIIDAISQMIQNRLDGVTADAMRFDRLSDCFEEIRDRYIDHQKSQSGIRRLFWWSLVWKRLPNASWVGAHLSDHV